MTVRLVTRDLVAAALAKQAMPVTATQLAAILDEFGCGDYRLISKSLQQLEARGLAVREPDRAGLPGRPDQWRAASPVPQHSR